MIHQRTRARVAGLVAVATATTAVLTGGPAGAAPAATPAAPTGPASITLITGDVVTLGGPRGVDVTAAPGREHIGFRSHTDVRGDIHVVPDDALPALSAGRIDPRLFDVSGLARAGYGREDLPLIVDYPGATPRSAGARAVRELPSMSAVALRVEPDARFWPSVRSSAKKIWLDGRVEVDLEHSVPQIGAPTAWEAGLTGADSTVAVLDTGIDTTHPDLDDAVADARDFTESESGTDDRFGHGTHVASIITGSGDRYRGVAPDAKLLNGKVLDDFGGGYESGIIAGMEWAATSGADVVNMSLGGEPTDGTDPMSLAVNRITADTGALFVISAGNSGPGEQTVDTPGAADAALTVGAVDRSDELASFSSRGPRRLDGAIKPDITAPGVDIVAAKAAQGWIGQPVEDGYVSLSGTSMAAPHVAGAAAILAGQHPDWTAERLKSTLMGSAAPAAELSVFEQGAGRVDVAAAVDATVSASPASLSLGVFQWPHEDDQPVAKTVTYTNSGTEPLTLDVAAELTGPDGAAPPEGMFSVSPAKVTVPAGGSAEVTLTTDTRVEAADGTWTGALVATGGETTLRTLTALNREPESYDVALTFLDHEGAPTADYAYRFVDLNSPKEYARHDVSGSFVVRLPKGEYYLDATVLTPGDFGSHRTDFTEPKVVVNGPVEYTFDARDGVDPAFVVDKPGAESFAANASYWMDTAWGRTGADYFVTKFDSYRTRPSRTSAPGEFEFTFEEQLAEPDEDGPGLGFHASPYIYNVRKTVAGAVPADLVFRVTDGELAKVRSTHAVATPGKVGVREGFVTMPLPFTLTEYYTPDVGWYGSFHEANIDEVIFLTGMLGTTVEPKVYRRGGTTHERWNVGVFGPGLPLSPRYPEMDLYRQGDWLEFYVPMHSDQDPGRDSSPILGDGTTELIRDGEVVEELEFGGYVGAWLPPEPATYTVRTTTTGQGPLSTKIDAEWTFTSGYTDERTPVPALAVRFAPNLDDHNTAPAGRRFQVPLYVQRNGTESPGRVGTPAVEVSYDDGATWRKARVTQSRNGWTAELDHPRGAEFVSLRSSVSDRDGNVAKQTILHAYGLR